MPGQGNSSFPLSVHLLSNIMMKRSVRDTPVNEPPKDFGKYARLRDSGRISSLQALQDTARTGLLFLFTGLTLAALTLFFMTIFGGI